MAIRELTDPDFTVSYTRTQHGSQEAELAAKEQYREDKKRQKVTSCVARGCTVETVRGTTLTEFEPISAADVGGHANLEKLERVWAASIVSEREAATNRGELEFRVVEGKSISHARQIWVGGFSGKEWDIPAEPPVQRVDGMGRVITTEGRPAVDGTALAESLITKGLVERARLRDAVVAKVKQTLRGKSDAKASE